LTRIRIAIASLATVAFTLVVGGGVYFFARAASPTTSGRAIERVDGAMEPVAVNVTGSGCEPNEISVPAGRVTFSIHNASARAVEWEILNGVMVVDERENIAPGFAQKLTTKLAPGDYDVTCGLLSNPRGKLHVAALPGASAEAKFSQVDLIGPLAEYRVYASYEIDALVDDTRRLAEALKSGDLELARESFPVAHAHYARIAPIAVFFPDLDGGVEPHAHNDNKSQADPASTGFRQLEWDLYAEMEPREIGPLADRLAADVVALQSRFEDLALTPAPTISGAAEAMGAMGPQEVGDAAAGRSGSELSDLQANVEGVKKIIDLFGPLIQKVDNPLSQSMAGDFAALDATLAKYRNADGAIRSPANLSADDRTALRNTAKKLAGELGLICSALGLS
jgi:iron uptake system component EfeO